MSNISPGPQTNSGTPANAFEVRAVDPQETGKEKSDVDDSNAVVAGAQAYEQRVKSDPGH